MWFTESGANKIGRITTGASPTITEYAIPTASSSPQGITLGPDNALWFTESNANQIGRITIGASPSVTEYPVPTASSLPLIITSGSDGALWFTEKNASKIGRISIGASPVVSEVSTPNSNSLPVGIASGSDGYIYFTETNNSRYGRFAPSVSPVILDYLVSLTYPGQPLGITPGPNGTLFFTYPQPANSYGELGAIYVPSDSVGVTFTGDGQGRVSFDTPAQGQTTTSFCEENQACSAAFPDGNVVTLTASANGNSVFRGWSGACSGVGQCTVTISNYTSVTAAFSLTTSIASLSVTRSGNGTGAVTSYPSGIDCGATCNATFDRTAVIQTPIPGMPLGFTTSKGVVTLTATPASGSTFIGWSGAGCSGLQPCDVQLAQVNSVNANFVADSSSDITLVSALLPTSRSVQVGSRATFFGTMINTSTDTAGTDCTVAPTANITGTFSFQTTDPATNTPTGTPNTPVMIPPGAAQSFLMAVTPASAFAPINLAFSFTCTNSAPAASNMGLNTLLLSASGIPVPDIIALGATVGNNGIVDIPGTTGTGAFAVATANVGIAGGFVAFANDGAANLPVTITICETNPVSGQCLAPPAANVLTTINAGATPTFAVFVKATSTVPFLPAANRIFVQFQDSGQLIRGSTSVAVRTQ